MRKKDELVNLVKIPVIHNKVENLEVNIANYSTQFSDMTNILLLNEAIRGTTQIVTQNSDENVIKIQHINSNNIIIREDNFVYETNLVTEVRKVMSIGETLTFKYHTDTMSVEVI